MPTVSSIAIDGAVRRAATIAAKARLGARRPSTPRPEHWPTRPWPRPPGRVRARVERAGAGGMAGDGPGRADHGLPARRWVRDHGPFDLAWARRDRAWAASTGPGRRRVARPCSSSAPISAGATKKTSPRCADLLAEFGGQEVDDAGDGDVQPRARRRNGRAAAAAHRGRRDQAIAEHRSAQDRRCRARVLSPGARPATAE